MKIGNKGPLMCPAYSFLLMEQMLTFFHKNSVSYELEGKNNNRITLSIRSELWDSLN